eukprot:3573125-Alexandrium_andersonii.AAC.1
MGAEGRLAFRRARPRPRGSAFFCALNPTVAKKNTGGRAGSTLRGVPRRAEPLPLRRNASNNPHSANP